MDYKRAETLFVKRLKETIVEWQPQVGKGTYICYTDNLLCNGIVNLIYVNI